MFLFYKDNIYGLRLLVFIKNNTGSRKGSEGHKDSIDLDLAALREM